MSAAVKRLRMPAKPELQEELRNGAPERKERRKSIPFNFNDLGQF